MSNYFKILNRLEKRQREDSPGPAQLAVPAAEGRPASLGPTHNDAVYTELWNNLRARIRTVELPRVVIAGATVEDSVDEVVVGLVGQARSRSRRLLVGELTQDRERRTLRRHPRIGTSEEADSREVDCTGRPAPEALQEWVDAVGRGWDLVVIAAPSIDVSVETTLLAKAGEGLVLVVHPFATSSDGLRTAVERARTAGCPILGLVLNGTREPLPRWLRRLLETLLE